jgi:hypothetical protein
MAALKGSEVLLRRVPIATAEAARSHPRNCASSEPASFCFPGLEEARIPLYRLLEM